ncbi:MAG: nicotinate-nucleotide adenylyltransferase [Chloroflexota bacterium]|nr:MAG: nicotinate-nucleotide adenylyltransferase [Chloroflexota bacterium]
MKIGVLGGTFDPIHVGHLVIAEEVRVRLGLSRVLFVPARISPLKLARPLTAAEDRLRMLELAVASNPYFQVSRLDVDRPGPSYSVDTLRELRSQIGTETQVFFIVGADALVDLPNWRQPRSIIELCQVVGVSRPGFEGFDPATLDPLIPGASRKILLLDVPEIGISASAIRARISLGLSIRYLVPEAVERYIYEHALYDTRTAAEG